jgi:tRNA modification GTPase
MQQHQHTIVALATPSGIGALGIIRLSGITAIEIISTLFSKKSIVQQASHTLHYGNLQYQNNIIDEVVIAIYKNPKSFTGEDLVEINCHGSAYIIEQIIAACIACGARLAAPGEFTQRAFLNGKLDLSQAEAVADIIASENAAQHKIALQQ